MVVSLDVVLPVLNEEKALSATVGTLCDFLSRCLSEYDWRVVIADNGSTDGTQAIGTQLAKELPGVGYTRLEEPGRGVALRSAWLASSADIVASVPELTKRTSSIDGTISTTSRASSASSSVGAPKLVPRSAARWRTATIEGWAWPRMSGPHERT